MLAHLCFLSQYLFNLYVFPGDRITRTMRWIQNRDLLQTWRMAQQFQFFCHPFLHAFWSLFAFTIAYAFRKLSTMPFQPLCQVIFNDPMYEHQWYFSKCGSLLWHSLCLQTLTIVRSLCSFLHLTLGLTVVTHFLKVLCSHKTENEQKVLPHHLRQAGLGIRRE